MPIVYSYLGIHKSVVRPPPAAVPCVPPSPVLLRALQAPMAAPELARTTPPCRPSPPLSTSRQADRADTRVAA